MNRNKYLLAGCCVIIASMLIIRFINIEARNARETELARTATAVQKTDSDILLPEEKPTPTPVPTPKPTPKPYVSAEAYLIGDLQTGEIYTTFNADRIFPIASVSKLYTALVVQHLFDQKKEITITQPMLDAYGDAGQLVLNEKYTSDELLYPLLIESSNDAAEAFAQSFGYAEFMKEMNGFADEIGLKHTSFLDSSGLNPGNISNAQDLFTLAQYLYKKEPDILKITDTKTFDFSSTTDHGAHHLININPYSNYSGFIGGKTGRTDQAKESMVSLFQQTVNGKSYDVAVIVLRSEFSEREIDTEKLLGIFLDMAAKKQ